MDEGHITYNESMSVLWQLVWKEAVEYGEHIHLHDGFVEIQNTTHMLSY